MSLYLTISILLFLCLIIIIKNRKKFKHINDIIDDNPIFSFSIVIIISLFWIFILPALFIACILYIAYLLFRKLTGL